MSESFNIDVFRSKAQSVLDHKVYVPTNEYLAQLEKLIQEILPGSQEVFSYPDDSLLKGYLDKARKRIHSLFYNAPVGYCILDENGVIVASNKAFCRLLSLDESAVNGEQLSKYLHPESVGLLNFQINKIIASKTTLSTTLWFCPGEKELQIRFQTTFYNEEGNDYLQCIATDISDSKTIENELETSELQFRNLLEASPAGILVMHKNKYIYSNLAAAHILGYENPEDLIGITALDVIAEESKTIIKDRILRLEKNIENETVEGDIICRDGTRKSCETSSIPVVFNNRISTLIILNDISARKNNDRLIRESEKKYKEMYQMLRLMCDNVPDMIWAKNLDNEYIFVNKAMGTGLLNATDTSEPVGKTDLFFALRERERHPNNPEWHTFGEICRDTDKIVLESKQTQRFDEQGNTHGEFLFLDVYKSPFYDSEGNLIGTVGSGRNVTRERWFQSEHGKAVDELIKQSARMNAMLNVLPDMLFVINLQGDFLDFVANKPAELAIDPALIRSHNLSHIFPAEEVTKQLKIYKKCIDSKEVLSFEYSIVTGEKKQYFEARTTPLTEDSVLVIARNITEKKQIEFQLRNYEAEFLALNNNAE